MKIQLGKDENGVVADPIVMLVGAAAIVVLMLIAFFLGMAWDVVGGGMIIAGSAVIMQFTPLKGWPAVVVGLVVDIAGLVILGIL